jgi:hypothetical protein
LARLVLGELPVNRVAAMWQYRTSLGNFGDAWYGKRACLHCFLTEGSLVLDSEWHWIFDCTLFNELRFKMPSLHASLRSILNSRGFAEVSDLGFLLNAIQNDSRLGFSLVSFVRQSISLREQWMSDNCVRGRLCYCPALWQRNYLRHPFSAEELPADFEQSFLDGKPLLFM